MTTRLYNAPGQIRTHFKVESIHRGLKYVTVQTGTNSSSNVRHSVNSREFIENGRRNAIYKHLAKINQDTTGISSGKIDDIFNCRTTLLGYEIKYYTNIVTIERKKYRKGEYYDVVTDRESGKVLGATKKKYEWTM